MRIWKKKRNKHRYQKPEVVLNNKCSKKRKKKDASKKNCGQAKWKCKQNKKWKEKENNQLSKKREHRSKLINRRSFAFEKQEERKRKKKVRYKKEN